MGAHRDVEGDAEGGDVAGRAALVITASDGVHHGTREDRSGDRLAERLREAGFTTVERQVVPDERHRLAAAVSAGCDHGARLVVVTGGTGVGPRDVTPEAVIDVTDRELPGFGEVMRAVGRSSTPLADLSRSLAAARGTSLVLAVPGSPTGALQSLEAVLELVPHALDLLGGQTSHGDALGHADHDAPGPVRDPEQPHGATAAGAEGSGPAHGEAGHVHDESCATAHGDGLPEPGSAGTLMAVFASPLSALLLAWGRELGYRTVLVDPRADAAGGPGLDANGGPGLDAAGAGMEVVASTAAADATTDVVVTDHHREELVDLVDAALDTDARFIGLMGSRRHEGPHAAPLRERGRTESELARIVRPIGLDIGSRTPAEIAVATLADLVARRSGRVRT